MFWHRTFLLLWVLWIPTSGAATATNIQPLSLREAENQALWDKFKLQPTKATLNSVDVQPGVDEPSSDTHLVFDTVNFSPNTLIPKQDDKTVVNVGVHRAFSNHESQEIQSQQAEVIAKQKYNQLKKRQLLRDVSHDWLELYYSYQASKIIEAHMAAITQLADNLIAAENLNTYHNIQEILQVKLDLTRVNNQKKSMQKKMTTAKTQLARWIGKQSSNRPLPDDLPSWPAPPSLPQLQAQLMNHPQHQANAAKIKAIQAEIAWTKELNKPTFEVGASYGMRQQDAINVDPKLNMITGEFSLNLPSHIGNTQVQDTIAVSNRLNQARQEQLSNSRNLLKTLIKQYQTWQNLDRQQKNSNNGTANILPSPLPNFVTPPSTTMLALQTQLVQLDTQLNQLWAAVDLAQARAALRYFEKD